jgi:hypothetical protein
VAVRKDRKDHFALAQARTFRNLLMMRACLKIKNALGKWMFIVALLAAPGFARAADVASLKTNSMPLGRPGTLEILTPPDWTLVQTNLNTRDFGPIFDLHAPKDAITIRIYTSWDGFQGKHLSPTPAEMGTIVSNIVTSQYLPVAKEKSFDLEKLKGPAVNGVFARVTDSKWTLLEKNTYPNIATGMFRSGNLWGNFDLLTSDKDGVQFKAGMKVLESLRRKP